MAELPEFHELCMLFPVCTDDELDMLREDVEKNGLTTPITLFDGKILDGRHRATVCVMLGIDPQYEEYKGDDPIGFVLSRNMCRRHLNESQRAAVAAKLSTMENSAFTQKKAAEVMNVSQRLVSDAAKVRKNADDDTIQAVERGDKTIHAAVKEMSQAELDADEEPSITDEEEQLLFLQKLVTRDAERLRSDMDKLFKLTDWSPKYKELHDKVRSIVFDE
jgi:predicted transcriptional regulator